MTHPASELDAEIQKTEARLAELQAQREALAVDPLLIEAREFAAKACEVEQLFGTAKDIRSGGFDCLPSVQSALAALRSRTALAPRPEVDEGWVDDVAKRCAENAAAATGNHPLSNAAAVAFNARTLAIRETLTRAPGISWPGGRPQEHWTVVGAIKSARALIEAGNDLCFAAETSGGTAGRDAALYAAIAQWAAERDKQKQVLRIIELEGDSPEIGAGSPDHPLREHMTGAAS
jgi:hypothetical protein